MGGMFLPLRCLAWAQRIHAVGSLVSDHAENPRDRRKTGNGDVMAASKGYQGRHNRDTDSPGQYKPKVEPDAPGKPGTKGPTKTRRRGPQHSDGGTATRKPSGAAKTAQREKRLRTLAEEARHYADRQAIRRTEGKPSVMGRAAGGAAAGVAAGAALGGPVGAAAGGAIGGIGGAISGAKARKAYKMAMHANLGARRAIVAEFLVCMLVAALSPLTDRKNAEGPITFMRRMTAIMALFLILGLISAAGKGSAKLAAGFGGLVTVALVVSNRDLFVKLAEVFARRSPDALGGGAIGEGALGGAQVDPAEITGEIT